VGFVIPSSKNKLYLSGCDWVISALDYMMKKTTCAGNISQVVLVLDSVINPSELQNHLMRFINEFPVVHGSVSRDINICPYWRIPEKAEGDLNFTSYNCSSESGLLPLLSECVNRPLKRQRTSGIPSYYYR
jgi:hypothetical protein